ncbi:Rz-like lysis system protein LysB [Paraburkholderia phenoliruptrix]|uniref:Rz-like lysis system protein LysB n=1 Tax=Paraburkholderia phenoliruptrix TaxID=252970 RepID=UPI00285C3480|nr:Rz-like lysis system protein LysB [Paraburkholderia phenoliruptrix]MDR6387571.1 LysB family phage lysis regulatory protein [Paraburkholderia phenoliruptrix]
MNPITARLVPIALKLAAIALVALAIAAGWFYVKSLRAELVDAQDTAHTAQETVGRRDATIVELQQKEREHAKALAQLDAKRAGIAASLAQTETDFEALKHENEALRTWADGALPDDVVRLYGRPAITGADEYLAMRARRALHAAGDGTAN